MSTLYTIIPISSWVRLTRKIYRYIDQISRNLKCRGLEAEISRCATSPQYCGTNTYQRVSPNSIITQQNIVKIKLFTDNSYNSNGASFIISPINSIDLNDNNNNIDQNVFCNNQLIHQNLVCDNILNCYDSTDESIGNSLGANLCPITESSLGIGYIILYIIVGILVLLIILGI